MVTEQATQSLGDRAYGVFLRWWLDETLCQIIANELAVVQGTIEKRKKEKLYFLMFPENCRGNRLKNYDPHSQDGLAKNIRAVHNLCFRVIAICERRISRQDYLPIKIDIDFFNGDSKSKFLGSKLIPSALSSYKLALDLMGCLDHDLGNTTMESEDDLISILKGKIAAARYTKYADMVR